MCPSTEEQMEKRRHARTEEYLHGCNKKNETLPLMTTWMGQEDIILSEISQSEKDKYQMIALTCGI